MISLSDGRFPDITEYAEYAEHAEYAEYPDPTRKPSRSANVPSVKINRKTTPPAPSRSRSSSPQIYQREEAAYLAAMIPSPLNVFTPQKKPTRLARRQRVVLKYMNLIKLDYNAK